MLPRAVFLISLLVVLGCTKKSALQESRWSGDGEKPSPPPVHLVNSGEWKTNTDKIQFSDQTVEGFVVDNSFMKTIIKDNTVVFQSYAVVPEVSKKVLKNAKLLSITKGLAWAQFLNKNPIYQNWKSESPPQVIIETQSKPTAVFTATLSNKQGQLFEVRFDQDGNLQKQIQLGSHLSEPTDVLALAFPKGPKKSDLSKIVLNQLSISDSLFNSRIEVKTESPLKISPSNDLEGLPMDERFDQVQAYYFANQLISWLEKKSLINGPFKLGILAHVGYPEKTNTAFYFNGLIRLGSGDDVTFTKIPWDPSIVMHEVSHAVIDRVARLPFQGEGGSVNEGFADVFTTFLLESPLLGENAYKLAPFKRAVDVPVYLSQKNGGLYHDSAIVSTFFWSLKKEIGSDKALLLAFKTLEKLAPNTTFQDYILSLKESSEFLTGSDLVKVEELMKKWGYL